jgi:hypothetical protein
MPRVILEAANDSLPANLKERLGDMTTPGIEGKKNAGP